MLRHGTGVRKPETPCREILMKGQEVLCVGECGRVLRAQPEPGSSLSVHISIVRTFAQGLQQMGSVSDEAV